MKRTSLIAAAIGATAVFGLTGTALAAAGDDTPSPSASVSPSADDGGLRGDGTADDDSSAGDDGGLRGDGTADDDGDGTVGDGPSASPSASADDAGLRGDGTVDDGPSAGPVATPSRTATAGFGISSAEAVRTALAAVVGGRLTKIEAEAEHGYRVWSIEVRAGGVEHDIDVDRTTGEIRRHRSDNRDDSSHGSDDNRDDGKHGSDDGRDDSKHGSDDGRDDDSGRGKHGSGDDDHGKHGSDD
jgi:Peptidase propeptide and YPEB domain